MQQYSQLIQDIYFDGFNKGDRTGTGTLSTFGQRLVHDFNDGFPLITTRKISLRVAFEELMWFIKGRTDLRYLLQRDIHIWTGDAYKRYVKACEVNDSSMNQWMRTNEDMSLSMYTFTEFEQQIVSNDEFSDRWGNLGPIYGKQWRDFNGVDQLQDCINRLKSNPDDRRLIVSAWNPADVNISDEISNDELYNNYVNMQNTML